ncbi:MAG: hypothetical protein WCG83_01900 [Candidatus Peregrinibacteria bacterium]
MQAPEIERHRQMRVNASSIQDELRQQDAQEVGSSNLDQFQNDQKGQFMAAFAS